MVHTFWDPYDQFNADEIYPEVALTGSSKREYNNNINRLLSKLTCTREMSGSKLGQDIGCLN
jgi:hypothetical protein